MRKKHSARPANQSAKTIIMITRTLFFFLFVCLFAATGMTQTAPGKDSIELKVVPLGAMKFFKNGTRESLNEVADILQTNPEAFKYIKKSKTNNTIGIITSVIGGFLVGFEAGAAIGGKGIDWGVMGAGAGFIIIASPFDIGAKRNARKAVHLYNAAYR